MSAVHIAFIGWILSIGFMMSAAEVENAPNDDQYVGDDDYYEEEIPAENTPTLLSQPLNLTVQLRETIRLPCRVDGLNKGFVLLWKKDSTVLSAGEIMITRDQRFKVNSSDWTLEIRTARADDSGQYTCQVSSNDRVELTHEVHVLVPASVVADPSDGVKVVRKGDKVTLKCISKGYPEPIMTWRRKQGKRFPSGETELVGLSLTIEKVSRHHSGVYECEANNGVGNAAVAQINLQVLYSPEIEFERNSINTKEGIDTEITCTVHAQPKATVSWYKDGKPIDTRRYTSRHEESTKYIVSINNVKQSDFGNFTCLAENSLGRAQEQIQMSGLPSQPLFKTTDATLDSNTIELIWTVDSYSPITEYILRYRKAQPNATGTWSDVILTPSPPDGYVYTGSYKIADWNRDDTLEAVVKAKNSWGWSKASRSKLHRHEGPKSDSVGGVERSQNVHRFSVISAVLAVLSISAHLTRTRYNL